MTSARQQLALSGLASTAGYVGICAFAIVFALAPPSVTPVLAPSTETNIEDMAGRGVHFNGAPHRILLAANIMPAFATLAGGTDRITASTKLGRNGMSSALLDRLYPQIQDIPSAGEAIVLDPERALLLAPDAIFGWNFQAASIQTMGFPGFVAFSADGSVGTDVKLWNLLGHLIDVEGKMITLRNRAESMQAVIASRLDIEPVQEVRVLILVSGTSTIWVGSQSHMLTARLSLARATNVATATATAAFDIEEIARLDPDVIFISTAFATLEPYQLYMKGPWGMIRAVRERRVYLVPDLPSFATAIFDPLLVEWLAEVLHPEIMPREMRQEFRKTYRDVYTYEVSDDEIDRVLNIRANRLSAFASRFEAGR